MSRRLVRITLEYDDGMIEELTGKEADAWMDDIVTVCDLADRKGQNPKWSEHMWKTKREPNPKT